MKAKILFVDDEIFVLEGLKRSLRPMRQIWDMYFTATGKEALELLITTPCDIIVSDMQMPAMNGAELMDRVAELYPNTMRLILSGHSDKDLILKCIKSTHQFLTKPCNVDELKSKLTGALRGCAVGNEIVANIVSRMEPLPSIPALYTEIMEAMQKSAVTVNKISEIVVKDVAMTANILKLANSSYFGSGKQISSIAEATNYLGIDSIRSLVLIAGAFSQFDVGHRANSSLKKIWDHSLLTASISKSFCHAATGSNSLAQECFVAGMLHDIGKLGLASHFPEQFGQAVDCSVSKQIRILEAEQTIFHTDHAEIGAFLLSRWGLPQSLIDAIAHHHDPSHCAMKTISALSFVHISNVLIHQEAPDGSAYAGALDLDYLKSVGLQSQLNYWRSAFLTYNPK